MIIGKNINLRLVKQSDIDELIALLSDVDEKGEFLGPSMVNEVNYKKQYQETGFWNDDFGMMVIVDKSGKVVGDICYFKGVRYLPGYEIGYNIYQREQRGKGYTSEALKLFSAYVFEIKQINRLEIHAAVQNIPSCRVAEKCGFTHEGTKRQACYVRGHYKDLNIYSLLKAEAPSFTELIKNV